MSVNLRRSSHVKLYTSETVVQVTNVKLRHTLICKSLTNFLRKIYRSGIILRRNWCISFSKICQSVLCTHSYVKSYVRHCCASLWRISYVNLCQTLLCKRMTQFLCETRSDIAMQANDAFLMWNYVRHCCASEWRISYVKLCQTFVCKQMTHFLCETMSDIIVQANDAFLMWNYVRHLCASRHISYVQLCQTLLCKQMTHFLCETMSDIVVQVTDTFLIWNQDRLYCASFWNFSFVKLWHSVLFMQLKHF